MAGRAGDLCTIALALAVAGVPACEVVDPGPDVGIASRCILSADFYLERIVPEYIERHGCADEAGCHRAVDANSIFRLQDTAGVLEPSPGDPVGTWPAVWQENFRLTAAQVSDCDLAEIAPLYSEPAGGDTLEHGGGALFDDGGPELELIAQWLASGS